MCSSDLKGKVTWDTIPLRDPVLIKSDGYPTYHLAVVVDDHDMRISHVMRGDEWLSSAPLHLLLYEALGWQPPTFVHLSKILGADGRKLSKREGAASTSLFREQGYLPEALRNFVALIGWSPGDGKDRELFSLEELIACFSLDQLNSADGVFDCDKLAWMNGVYIRKLSQDDFIARIKPFFERAGLPLQVDAFRVLAPHIQERAKTLAEVPAMVEYLFNAKFERDLSAVLQKGVDRDKAKVILLRCAEELSALSEFSVAGCEAAMRGLVAELGIKAGALFMALRIAITGRAVSPPLFESMLVLGRQESVRRILETGEAL